MPLFAKRPPGSSRDQIVVTSAALCAALGFGIALGPWLGRAFPLVLGVPAIGVVALLCGWRWGAALAALIVVWLTVPWLIPSWPSDAMGYRAWTSAALFASAGIGLLRGSPAQPIPIHTPAARRQPGELATVRRGLRFAMAIAVAAPMTLVGVLALNSYETAQTRARLQADSTLQVAAEHASRVVQANTIVTRQVLARLQDMTPATLVQRRAEFHRELATLAQGLPHINSIWVIGADGFPLASSLVETVPPIDYSDREYFQFHRSHRDQIYVTRLLRTRSTKELFYDVSARWDGPNGEFLGLINVTLRPEYMTEFYRQLSRSAPAISIALARTDGYLIAGAPHPPEVGDRLPTDHALMKAFAAGAPQGSASRSERPRSQSIAYSRLDQWPLAVTVTLDHSRVAGQWRRESAPVAGVILLASLSLVGALWIALRRTEDQLGTLSRLNEEMEQRSRAESALKQAQKMEALGRLTGGVAHDFNNLLAVFQNNLQVMARRYADFAGSASFSGMARAVTSGQQLTRKLLAFARRQPLRLEALDLAETLPGIADLLRLSVGSRVAIAVDLAPDTPAVRVDRSEFELALLNLAMNARAAGACNVRIAARPAAATSAPGDTSFVDIQVADDGIGMPDEVRTRAFEPFFTTKPEGEGTGLGLSQVYGMCTQAGGAVELASQPGRGTTVTMTLPACAALPTVAPPATLDPASEPLSLRVLLVDDNADLAEASAAALESLGADVEIAVNAAGALARLADPAHGFAVVLSDIVMPGEASGLVLAQQIRALYPGLPVVLTTGYTTEIDKAVAAGLTVLAKPVAIDVVTSALRDAVATRPVAAQADAAAGPRATAGH
jgi:signal transduction histidine kinase/ActR/RegA family two-component response regulator